MFGRETPTQRPEALTLLPKICPKAVKLTFDRWYKKPNMHNGCGVVTVYMCSHKTVSRMEIFNFNFKCEVLLEVTVTLCTYSSINATNTMKTFVNTHTHTHIRLYPHTTLNVTLS